MKRLLLIFVLVLTLPAEAQVADTNRADAREIGSGERQHRKHKSNVIGAPVYYDTLGNIRGMAVEGDSLERLPKHHYLNRLSYDYCSYFFELEGMLGTGDIAIGINFSYLPERWGVYGSALVGVKRDYFSVGPVLRLSDNGDCFDWHLYGGVMVSRHIGAEIGCRIALPRHAEKICWESMSLGAVFVNGHAFFTCGLSLELAAIASTAMLWW